MMATADRAVTVARDAERQLWQHYGLTVVEHFAQIDRPPLRIRMLECGSRSAEPLMFVQGGLGDAFGWASLMARLTDFRCITLDRPGGGFSDGVNFLEVDVRKLAVEVLQAVLDAAGVSHAPFVANSMGGWWTFQLARRAPTLEFHGVNFLTMRLRSSPRPLYLPSDAMLTRTVAMSSP